MEILTTKPNFIHFLDCISNFRNTKASPQVPRFPQTVAEIAEAYLQSCRGRIKRSTCSTYATVIERHIRPEFGTSPICALSREDIGAYLSGLSFGEEAMSASSVRLIVSVLRALFRYAAAQGLPVISPEAICRPSAPAKETRVLSASEQRLLRDYLCRSSDCVHLGVLICLYTGLRIGEMCAMKWGDLCVERGTLSVRRTVQRIKNLDYGEGGGTSRTLVVFDAPKSRAAARCIPIPAFLLEYLKLQRRDDDCFILTGSPERFMEPRVFQSRYRVIMKRAGLEYVNFHALRHTFATNCVNLGFDVKSLSEILGHSDVSVTLNTYVHPSVSVKRAYMNLLE